VDNSVDELRTRPTNHRNVRLTRSSYTGERDTETGTDLRGHELSTVSTAPVNTTHLDLFRISGNISPGPDLGTTGLDTSERGNM
jgi:hypothetical protein